VICPKQPGDQYPERNLAGVGLAYKICEALLIRRPMPGICLEEWLDLVAVGTVADIVPLTGENRSMVRAGLRQLRMCRRQGLFSLARLAEMKVEAATARDIGFVIGPRLNAAGRLESALASFDLLTTSEIHRAAELAQKLDNQNRERQDLTRKMQEQAELMADAEKTRTWSSRFIPNSIWVWLDWSPPASPTCTIDLPLSAAREKNLPALPAAVSPNFTSRTPWMNAQTCSCGMEGMPWRLVSP
jgi:single-stranded DNA-specific DHH superfamily exonuclease